MHHIYHTRAIILGSKNIGESNRLLFVLTRDLGLVAAAAQGVRELKSKLRYSLQDFGVSDISMVRGKNMWRVTSAENIHGHQDLLTEKEKAELFARICVLVRRLVHGEEKNEQLFGILEQLFSLLRGKNFTKKELWRAELIVNLQILSVLGYASGEAALKQVLAGPLSRDLLSALEGKEKTAVREINSALKESQL